MKTFRFLAFALLALGVLASCSKENNNTPDLDNGTAVQFSTAITRASGTAWDDGDAIGVFMLNTGGTMPSDIVGSGTSAAADNVQYTTDGTKFSTITPIYYPQAGNVDFVAYYPYRTTPNPDPYIYKVDVATQTTPANIDLLYASNSNVAKSKTAVPLQFNHKLSQMVLTVKKGEGMATADLSTMSITISAMPTKADFALADGTFGTSTTGDITPRTITAGTQYDAIVIPQAGTTGRKMIFTVGADVYEYAIPATDDFASGKSYDYTVTVAKTGVSVSRGDITDWTGTTGTPDDLGEAIQIPIPQTVLIPAGTFMMGSPADEPNRSGEETQHAVTLTKDFYMSKYAITFAQYDAYCAAKGTPPPSDQGWGRGDRPVISVSWNDAVAYCEWLSTETGLTYRLPTEAEWEYACRGDYPNKATEAATLPFGIGDGSKLDYTLGNFNWEYSYELPGGQYTENTNTYPGKTMPVGSYAANSYGLYDMHGNVFEWCSDWFHSDYSQSGIAVNDIYTDPTGPATGSYRVVRGGSWYYNAQYCRSAFRYDLIPDFRNYLVGFRVVFVP